LLDGEAVVTGEGLQENAAHLAPAEQAASSTGPAWAEAIPGKEMARPAATVRDNQVLRVMTPSFPLSLFYRCSGALKGSHHRHRASYDRWCDQRSWIRA